MRTDSSPMRDTNLNAGQTLSLVNKAGMSGHPLANKKNMASTEQAPESPVVGELGAALKALQRGALDEAHKLASAGWRGDGDLRMAYIAGLALARMDRPYEAAEYLQLTVQGDSPQRDCLCEYGRVLMETQLPEKGIAMLARAVIADPASPYAWRCYAEALASCAQFSAAIVAAERGLNVLRDLQLPGARETAADNQQRLLHALAISWAGVGDVSRAGAAHARALKAFPQSLATTTAWASFINYVDASEGDSRTALERVCSAAAALAPCGTARLADPWTPGSRPLRIGLLTPDLRDHPVAQFITPLLANINAADVNWFIYDCAPVRDSVSDRCERLLGTGSKWLSCSAWDAASLANAIASDSLDVIIDLAGWTAGSRTALLTVRLAPLQLAYLGYPQATGLTPGVAGGIDRVIADATVCSFGNAGPHGVLTLPGCFMCWEPPTMMDSPVPQRTRSALVGPDEGIVLGCFNNPAKISPRCGRVWASILKRLPTATLVIKSRGLEHASNQKLCYDALGRHGIDLSRVILRGQQTGRREHLAQYNSIDLALDTFPYNGATTTCEALWMGVNVVTLAESTMQSRVGASLLAAAGIESYTCDTEERYINRVVAAAGELAACRSGRAQLRESVAASALCDAPKFAPLWLACVREAVETIGNALPRRDYLPTQAATQQ